jgi:unsaturated chondroitin disaccharide hydrolase
VGLFQVGTKDGEWFVIVDSAMNADLLFHGAQLTTDPDEAGRLRAIAHQHLLTLARDFVRTDGSTRHLLVYNPETGELIGERDGAGYSTSTTWARGQAWAIYGFAMGYRRTGDDRLLAAARATADYWLARIGADCVPRWDFDAPDDSPFQDSSAAAVAASGLFDLAAIEPDTAVADGYRSTALSITAALTTAAYTTAGTNHPAVLRRQTYQIARVPAPTEGSYSWGDHYLLEAMTKSLRLLNVSPQLQLSAPARVRYGDTVAMRVTGTLPGGAPAAGIPLTLQRRAQGTPSWVTVATGTTGFRGRASFTVRPTGGGQLRVLSGAATTGVARFTPAVSTARTISVSVRAALTFAGRYSDKYVLSMPYVAAPSGTRFALQEKLGSGWATVSTVRWLPRTSTKRRLVSSSRYFRVVPLVPAATGVVGVVSSTVTVPRR